MRREIAAMFQQCERWSNKVIEPVILVALSCLSGVILCAVTTLQCCFNSLDFCWQERTVLC